MTKKKEIYNKELVYNIFNKISSLNYIGSTLVVAPLPPQSTTNHIPLYPSFSLINVFQFLMYSEEQESKTEE